MDMTLAQLVQLYAPLAGLLVLAFWTGRLGQKVDDQKESLAKASERIDALEQARATDGADAKFARIEEQMIQVKETLGRMELSMARAGLHGAPPLG